ncbi:MAG: sulfatase-like hydrolase/transferase [Propionibacteriaceae bacterium]|nr:sulfatase-like hydrolase/transferase [Propionibacteriaceae bacterium]
MKPNFVLLQTDDQGRWAVPWRMPELPMPHLASFAEGALELDQLYCASPVCSPSRASVLTGRLPSAHGVHDWLVGDRDPGAFPDSYLQGQITTPEVLADAGYQCAMVGKWHLGDASQPAPGFEYWYAHRYGGGPYFDAPIWRDGEPVTEPRYFTDAVTDNAVEFLQERDPERPFYLQINYTAPHDPWIDNHLPEDLVLFDGCDFPSVPREPEHPWSAGDFAAAVAHPEPHLAGYCASLVAVDRGFGRILALLDELGLAENTVVAWFGDNGFSCGHHGIWGKGNGTWPLNFWDNSVRVPCVVRAPGAEQGVSSELLSAASWHATICELAGVALPEDEHHVGESFADVLHGTREVPNEVVVVVSEYGGGRMVTDGRYVLVLRHEGPGELFDNETDPQQRDNRFDDETLAEVRARLTRGLDDWFARGERPGYSAYEQPVSGRGQRHPLSRALPPEQTYLSRHEQTNDGVR